MQDIIILRIGACVNAFKRLPVVFLRLFFVFHAQVACTWPLEGTAFAACGTVLYTTERWE